MVFIWTGRGIFSALVVIAVFVCLVFTLPDNYKIEATVFSLYCGGIFSYIFGVKWNNEIRTLQDAVTGKAISLRVNHSLFYLKMQYWSLVFTILALIILGRAGVWSGSQLLINISLGLIGIGLLSFYYYKIFHNPDTAVTIVDKGAIKATITGKPNIDKYTLPKSNFDDIKNAVLKNDDKEVDHSKYMPK